MATPAPTLSPRPASPRRTQPPRDDSLRALAIERIHRMRRFKLHLVAFAVGIPALTALWVLTEYYEEHTWPSRFASDPDVAGTWDPWLFFVAGIWLIILDGRGCCLRRRRGHALRLRRRTPWRAIAARLEAENEPQHDDASCDE